MLARKTLHGFERRLAQPARGNILYNQLLREQISRRNTEIAQENTRRRQQVALTVAPIARAGGGR